MMKKISKFLGLVWLGLGLVMLLATILAIPSWGLSLENQGLENQNSEKQRNYKPPSFFRPYRSPVLSPAPLSPSPLIPPTPIVVPLLRPERSLTEPPLQVNPPIPPVINQFYEPEDPTEDRKVKENTVILWDNLALNSIRSARPGPPIVSRVLTMVHTAQYEAWSQYDQKAVGTLLGAKYRQPLAQNTENNKTEAMNYAAYRVLVDLFPDFSRLFSSAMKEANLDINVTTTTPDTPAGMGNLAAAAVLTYRHDDGANQLGDRHPGAYSDYTNYQPVNSPTEVKDLNHWQPIATTNGSSQGGCIPGAGSLTVQTYVGPHWGLVIPFALDDGEAIVPSKPPAHYPSPEFSQQVQEVIDISANLTDRQKAISEYWVDGPASELPPGHWALIAQEVSKRRHHTLDDDAKLFFAVSNANLDAGILAWKIKRTYDSVRPITAIRELMRGQKIRAWGGPGKGTELINGEDWEPYQDRCFVTPAFPEFISGHSTFSAASAEVLKSFTGSDNFPNLYTVRDLRLGNLQNPMKLQWRTFSEAADEAGISRRYGGIHFAQGDLVGRELGRKVGARVWAKAQRFFAGTATPVNEMS